jgi:8-oxo-dGTP pyrophosphatase MutT (NUDIX family)
MAKKEYQAAGGVVIHDGRMLLLDRPSRGEVRLPKGHIERGEDAQSAALREVMEESGYAGLEILADLGSRRVEFDYDGARVVRSEHYFVMGLVSDLQFERSKGDANQFNVLWAPLDTAPSLLTYAAEQDAAQRAAETYRGSARGQGTAE